MSEESKENQPASVEQKHAPSAIQLFLESHGIPLAAAKNMLWTVVTVVLAIVVVIGVFSFRNARARRIEDSSRLLLDAAAQMYQPNSSARIAMLLDRYPSGKNAPLILLTLASAQYAEGNYVVAGSTYDNFLSKYPDHTLVQIAELGKIECREAQQDNLDTVLADYTAFIAKHPGSFLVPQAVFGQGRCLDQLGRLEEARQVYEDFKTANPDSVWKDKIETALTAVETEIKRRAGTL